MSGQKKFANSKEIIGYLAEKFPLCFSLEGQAKPLKIGLFQELAEALKDDEHVSKTQLRHALRQYTMSCRYLHACKEGEQRVDLQGNACGVLEAEHIEHATIRLKEAKERIAQKRAEQRKEQGAKKTVAKRPFSKKKPNSKESKGGVTKAKNPLKPVSELAVGMRVKLQNGRKGSVLEVLKDEARVELDTGLTLKVKQDLLFL